MTSRLKRWIDSFRINDLKPDFWILSQVIITAWVVMGSPWLIPFLWPHYIGRCESKKRTDSRREDLKLKEAFIEKISYWASATYAGVSMEKALVSYLEVLRTRQSKHETFDEFTKEGILQLCQGGTLKAYLIQLERQFPTVDIIIFCRSMRVGYETGGAIHRVFAEAVMTTKESYEMDMEIQTVVAEKMMEAKVIGWMPYLVIFYLRISMADVFSPMLTTVGGLALIQFLIIIFEGSSYMARRIADIKM